MNFKVISNKYRIEIETLIDSLCSNYFILISYWYPISYYIWRSFNCYFVIISLFNWANKCGIILWHCSCFFSCSLYKRCWIGITICIHHYIISIVTINTSISQQKSISSCLIRRINAFCLPISENLTCSTQLKCCNRICKSYSHISSCIYYFSTSITVPK